MSTLRTEARRDLKLAPRTAADRDFLSWHFWEIVQDQIAQVSQLSFIEYDASTRWRTPKGTVTTMKAADIWPPSLR